MPFGAQVIEVMIVSPGDVDDERNIVRDVVHDWNATNARDRHFVILPVGWGTNTVPLYRQAAQPYIDQAVLKNADLVVAIFKHRIGTATSEYRSGSVHELDKHTNAGKPALIYFYAGTDASGETDAQKTEVEVFQREARGAGLIETYSSIDNFALILTRHLSRALSQVPALRGLMDSAPFAQFGTPTFVQSEPPPLMSEAQQLLLAAAFWKRAVIRSRYTAAGTQYQVGDVVLCNGADERVAAAWDAALDQLFGRNLLVKAGSEGRVSNVTHAGYDMAEKLLAALAPALPYS